MFHLETCFRLSLCAVPKNVHFWNKLQISTVQTLSYWSRTLNARSWRIKTCARSPKLRPFLHLFVCLFFFPVISVGLFKCNEFKRHHCCLPSMWQSLHSVNLKHVSEWHIYQDGTQCQSETCFKVARNSHKFSTNFPQATRFLLHIYQNGTQCESETCFKVACSSHKFSTNFLQPTRFLLHIYQNDTQCESETCFRMARNSYKFPNVPFLLTQEKTNKQTNKKTNKKKTNKQRNKLTCLLYFFCYGECIMLG